MREYQKPIHQQLERLKVSCKVFNFIIVSSVRFQFDKKNKIVGFYSRLEISNQLINNNNKKNYSSYLWQNKIAEKVYVRRL